MATMTILGVETSCDDTAIAVVDARDDAGRPAFRIRSNVISGQLATHAQFGGVVPTLAAREHAKNFVPTLSQALKEANCAIGDISLIAVTTHPGLFPSLIVGVHAARALAWERRLPILGVDHLAGHLAANLLDPEAPKIPFPAIALIVSGGHTQLVLLDDLRHFRVVGETRDDAAGEAFDKVAKLIGLPFPGGPPIAAAAERWSGTAAPIALPRPMLDQENFDFSFSGLKTAVLYFVRDRYGTTENPDIPEEDRAALCAAFQDAVVDVLVQKTIRAAKHHRARAVLIGGGVAANAALRARLREALPDRVAAFFPPTGLSVDNGAMIAAAAYLRWREMDERERASATWQSVQVGA